MTTETEEISRSALLAGACLLIAVAGMIFHSFWSTPAPVAAAPPTRKMHPENVFSGWASAPESRVTFDQTMPRTNGAQILNSTGKPNLEMVTVAIPDGPNTVRFVRGSDPAAVKYIAETQAEQRRLIFDKGPKTLDTSEIVDLGPLKGRATRHARNLDAKDAPPPSSADSP